MMVTILSVASVIVVITLSLQIQPTHSAIHGNPDGWADQLRRPMSGRLTANGPMRSERLASNVSSASAPSSSAPDMYYYITDKYVLMRIETGKPPVRIAENVVWSASGYDDSLWYTDAAGAVWRLHYHRAAQKVLNAPQNVAFVRLAPRSYQEAFLVTSTGDLYHFVEYDWIKDPSAKNVRDVGVGAGGSWMYVDRSNVLWYWEYVTQTWRNYERNGTGFDLFDSRHVVVLDEKSRAFKKNGNDWVDAGETCREVFIMEESFFCVTFGKELKLVPY
ncbi:uncharacterized protein LOC129600660 [Paramacrobiotus metropolitanus]|uniref:uncharacterized protein LOC129600660 n=1 Tax=Paramacrobiotus metropolitanus TaxID=2943436 RepID=UPI0024457AB3|nr:uncharacterized protein LOC129600660 [Paramacrobiotus metropolitanus]